MVQGVIAIAGTLLSDELWDEIEHLLPQYEPSPLGGWPPVAHRTAIHSAPARPLRVVAVEPLLGGRTSQAFYSTCSQAAAEQVVSWYAMRWSLEVAFQDSKQSFGFQEPQGWTRRAVERTDPMAMLLYSLIVLWFVDEGHRHYRAFRRPCYTTKQHAAFADMLTTLRRETIRERLLPLPLTGPGSRKLTQALENMEALAA